MPNLKHGKDCCGCTACASICGKNAISMRPDTLGFLYPQVDVDLCVNCGLCEKVCNFREDYPTPHNFLSPIPYGVRLKNMDEVMKSRSGGAFKAFSDWILSKNGVIYGAGFKEHFKVAHCRATTAEERDIMRGSKYVQSDLTGVFRSVKNDLAEGKWVLFSGTPCQTSGLQSFIPQKLQTNLLIVDIVCHGVPSPQFWKDYVDYIEEKHDDKIIKVYFRDKERYGWAAHRETFLFHKTVTTSTIFTYLFYQHIMLRESCEKCHFTNTRRPSDLTLADFWGWEKTDCEINRDDKGLSLILVNTPKGKTVFKEVSDELIIINPKLENCLQAHLLHPTTPHPQRQKFVSDYERYGFKYVISRYGNIGWRYHIKNFSFRVIRKLKHILKKS